MTVSLRSPRSIVSAWTVTSYLVKIIKPVRFAPSMTTIISTSQLEPSVGVYVTMYCRMMPLGERGGVQETAMEVELVLMASIIIGAEGAGGGGN